jgi:hypothetical protein
MVDIVAPIAASAPPHLRLAEYWLPVLILVVAVAALLLLPCWGWASGLGYHPSGFCGLLDLTLAAGLMGRG